MTYNQRDSLGVSSSDPLVSVTHPAHAGTVCVDAAIKALQKSQVLSHI